jgi:hypothetical protein
MMMIYHVCFSTLGRKLKLPSVYQLLALNHHYLYVVLFHLTQLLYMVFPLKFVLISGTFADEICSIIPTQKDWILAEEI